MYFWSHHFLGVLPVHVTCTCYLCMLPVHVPVHVTCACNLCMLPVHVTCACCCTCYLCTESKLVNLQELTFSFGLSLHHPTYID
jgi:hypothetical protein